MPADSVPRYLPDWPFPPYSFVPGQAIHPRRPGGHAHDEPPSLPSLLDAQAPQSCRPFLRGLDLFNHGYYWEAHEEWEGLWRQAHDPLDRALLQGLIRLAAAGVKVRQGLYENVHSHGQGAARLFAQLRGGTSSAQHCGLDIEGLVAFAHAVAELRERSPSPAAVQVVFAPVLRLV